jgi:hypothetical protein
MTSPEHTSDAICVRPPTSPLIRDLPPGQRHLLVAHSRVSAPRDGAVRGQRTRDKRARKVGSAERDELAVWADGVCEARTVLLRRDDRVEEANDRHQSAMASMLPQKGTQSQGGAHGCRCRAPKERRVEAGQREAQERAACLNGHRT